MRSARVLGCGRASRLLRPAVRPCPVCDAVRCASLALLVWAARGLPPETSRCLGTLRGPRRVVCVGGLWTPGAVLPLSCIPKVAGVGDTWCPAEGGGQGRGTHPRVQLRTPPGSDVLSPALPSGGFRAFSLLARLWVCIQPLRGRGWPPTLLSPYRSPGSGCASRCGCLRDGSHTELLTGLATGS